MFPSTTYQQRVQFRREDKAILALILLLAPAVLMATLWVIAAAVDVMSLPGGDLAGSFLRDTFGLQIFTLFYVVTVSAIVCAPCDPVNTRLATRWAFTTILFSLFPRVVQFVCAIFEDVGEPDDPPTGPGDPKRGTLDYSAPAVHSHTAFLPRRFPSDRVTPPIAPSLRVPISRGHRMGFVCLFRKQPY